MDEHLQIGDRTNEMTQTRAPRLLLLLALSALALLASIAPAGAATFEGSVKEFDVDASTDQAGGHPNVALHIKINLGLEGAGCLGNPNCDLPRNFQTHFPTGFIGNPHVAPQCTLTQYNQQACPSDAQVGVVDVGEVLQPGLHLVVPLYNMQTNPDQAGLLAFFVPLIGSPIFLELTGRTDSDYGLDAISSTLLPGVNGVQAYLWGVPADPSHDPLRFATPLKGLAACFEQSPDPAPPFGEFPNCQTEPGALGAKASIPPLPYLQNPTTCGVELRSNFEVEFYDHSVATASSDFPPMTGCQQLSFNPSLTVKPTTASTDTASGLDIVLKVPQTQSPETAAPSEIRVANITLPQGFSINPNAADGKAVCKAEESAIGSLLAAHCPEFSKIGTLSLDIAALPAPLPGALYLAEPKPGDPYRVLLVADGFATHVKLLGSAHANEQTGRVTLSFAELPQAPLQEFNMHLFGSERGLFATPTRCGTYPVEAEFVPWDSQLTTRRSTSFLTVSSGPNGAACPGAARPFAPSMTAGTSNATAGTASSFSVSLRRTDGDQNLAGLTVQAPPGLIAKLDGVPYCPEEAVAQATARARLGFAEQAAPSCPAASRVGSVVTGVGAGTHPLYTSGSAYLAGPYRGAPLSLLVVVPAVSGPYDLGNVAVRAAIDVNPVTTQVTVASDLLPSILGGLPLRTRSVLVNLDRPAFMRNPTDCDPLAVRATVLGDEGAASALSTRFQATNCGELDFAPKLSLRLRGSTKHKGNPALRAVLRTGTGEANLAKAIVTMPHAEFLASEHIRTVCTRVQFSAGTCPAASVYGHAIAYTPLLAEPIQGPVYLRSSDRDLPDLVADLDGQLGIELSARIDSVKGRLRSSFVTIPDAPVSRFVLEMNGGAKGLLVNSENLCGEPKKAAVRMTGQNGAVLNSRSKLQVSCGTAKRKGR